MIFLFDTSALSDVMSAEAGVEGWLIWTGPPKRYAQTKVALQRRGASLDENDLWIAATALALGATLVTRDTDFDRVAGLRVLSLSRG